MSKAQGTRGKAAKIETIEQILIAAQKAHYDMLAFARGARRSLAAVRSNRHEWNRSKSTIDGLPIHYFRTPGETLTGIIGPAEFELWKGTSYRFILDDGSIVRLPGNRQLNKLIKDCKCQYLRVRIEYLDKEWLTSRHYQKCYAIHPAPLKDESILDTKQGRAVLAKLGMLHEKATVRATKERETRTAEEKKAAARNFVKNMVRAGKLVNRQTLTKYKGEPWADEAIAKLKEAK